MGRIRCLTLPAAGPQIVRQIPLRRVDILRARLHAPITTIHCMLLGMLLLGGCDGSFHMIGVVYDSAGVPLPGATVSVYAPDNRDVRFAVQTDSSGHFEFYSVVAPGRRLYKAFFEMVGFKSAFAEIPTLADNYLYVVLEPDSKRDSSSASLVDGEVGLSRDLRPMTD
jgi:hypothetical protein